MLPCLSTLSLCVSSDVGRTALRSQACCCMKFGSWLLRDDDVVCYHCSNAIRTSVVNYKAGLHLCHPAARGRSTHMAVQRVCFYALNVSPASTTGEAPTLSRRLINLLADLDRARVLKLVAQSEHYRHVTILKLVQEMQDS